MKILFIVKFENYIRQQESENKDQEISPSVYFIKQTIGNACGTIALIHAVANNLDRIELPEGHLKKFLDGTIKLKPEDKAGKFETDGELSVAHNASALEGQTDVPNRDDKVDLHFIAMVENEGCLYELDGRKSRPINHGATTRDSFLKDAAKVCRNLMAVDPDNLQFTLIALAAED